MHQFSFPVEKSSQDKQGELKREKKNKAHYNFKPDIQGQQYYQFSLLETCIVYINISRGRN